MDSTDMYGSLQQEDMYICMYMPTYVWLQAKALSYYSTKAVDLLMCMGRVWYKE